MTTRFLLMRHALTSWNQDKRIQGQRDVCLCDEGRRQCTRWQNTIATHSFDCILTSPLQRARETATLVSGNAEVPLETSSGLMEMDWGDWTERDALSMKNDHMAVEREQERGLDFRPPGGESRRELLDRALRSLKESAYSYPGQTVLVVTHNGVLQVLARHMRGLAFLPGEPDPLRPYRLHLAAWTEAGLEPLVLNMEL